MCANFRHLTVGMTDTHEIYLEHFTLRFVLPRSWVGYPRRRPKGCGMQSPSGPKVWSLFSKGFSGNLPFESGLPEAYKRPTRAYQTLPDPTRPYQTLPRPTRGLPEAYQTLPDPTRPYQTLPDPTTAYQRTTRPYQTLPDPTGPYQSPALLRSLTCLPSLAFRLHLWEAERTLALLPAATRTSATLLSRAASQKRRLEVVRVTRMG